jgi:methyl-accepting chemotaxis protein
MLLRSRFRTLSARILLLGLVPVLLFILLFLGLVRPRVRELILQEKRASLRQMVELATGILQNQEAEVTAGRLDRASAEKRARELVGALRYDRTNYLFVLDGDGTMRVHPRAELIGRPVDALDPATSTLFRDLVRVARGPDGFHAYAFTRAGSVGLQPKISYVKTFEPWGWILGTGVYVDDVDALTWAFFGQLLLGAVLVGGASMVIASRQSRRISRPLRDLVEGLRRSDLHHRLEAEGCTETVEAAQAFNAYNDRLRGTVHEVEGLAERVASGSAELAASAEEMVRTVEELARLGEALRGAGEEVSGAMGRLHDNAEAMSGRTRQTSVLSGEAVQDTAEGARAGQEAVEGMRQIEEVMGRIVSSVQVIQDIARSTNLLSLNAAIEAAKAGAQGKGFAVVAEEIRKLAERSRAGAQEIAQLIQRTHASVAGGVERVGVTLEHLEAIRRRMEGIALSVREVGDLGQEQSGTTAEASGRMGQTASRLAQNAAATHQLATTVAQVTVTAEELARVADGLRQVVRGFER